MNGNPEHLYRRIKAAGLKHIEIAQEVGIGYAQLNQKLTGKRPLTQEQYDSVKRAFVRVGLRQIENIAKHLREIVP